jgi:hypothetical protein
MLRTGVELNSKLFSIKISGYKEYFGIFWITHKKLKIHIKCGFDVFSLGFSRTLVEITVTSLP